MKTQKKSMKKKALLSSLSMLMVATVAVGSATFAWFTQSPTANAQGLQLKATASNGLKIITETHLGDGDLAEATFLSLDYLNYDPNGKGTNKPGSSKESFMLNPASYDFDIDAKTIATKPYRTTAAADDNSAALGTAAVEEASAGTSSTDVYKEKIYCKLVGAANVNDKVQLNLDKITVDWNDTAVQTYALRNSVRILVTYTAKGATSETLIGAYAKSAIDTETSLKAAIDKSDRTEAEPNKDQKGYQYASKGTVKFAAMPQTKTTIGQLGTTGEDVVTVYVYLDGEDSNCTSKNIKASDLIKSIDVQLGIVDLPVGP